MLVTRIDMSTRGGGSGYSEMWAILVIFPNTRMIGYSEVEMGLAATYETVPGSFAVYVDLVRRLFTFQWGKSTFFSKPVVDLYLQRFPVTLAYVVPGAVVSVILGTGLSTYAAVRPNSLINRALPVVSYIGLSIPAFVLATIFYFNMISIFGWVQVYDSSLPLWHPQNVLHLTVPAGIVALNPFVVQVRHAQGETTEYLGTEFVKTACAKGAGRLRISRHIFRNAWPALASLVIGESLGLPLLTAIVIETALAHPQPCRRYRTSL